MTVTLPDLFNAAAEHFDMNLPARGLPRELTAEGLPIPFAVKQSSMGVAWAEIDSKLTALCTMSQCCHMCGLPVDDAESFAVLDLFGRAVDGWIMHRRCTRLAVAHCPYLHRAHNDHMFVAPAADLAVAMRDKALNAGVNEVTT